MMESPIEMVMKILPMLALLVIPILPQWMPGASCPESWPAAGREAAPSWFHPAGGAYFQAEINGFKVTSENVTRVPEGLLLATACIENFPKSLGGGKRIISNLGIRTLDMTVFQSGTSVEPFTATPPYGRPVTVGRLSLEADGLYADDVSVPLPKDTGGGSMTFQRLRLNPNGSFGQSAPLSDPRALSLSGYTAISGETVFNGSLIAVKSLSMAFGGSENLLITFKGLEISGQGVKTAGKPDGDIRYSPYGWNFTLKNTTFNGTIVTAESTLTLPKSFDSYEIDFPGFRLLPNGDFLADPLKEEALVRIHGWQIALQDARISGSLITCPRAVLSLYALMGGDTITIPDIALRSDGVLERCGASEEFVDFVTTTGFWVEAESFWFDSQSLKMKARVFFPESLGQGVSVSYDEIPLNYDGGIVTPPRTEPLTYSMAGWKVTAQGYWFDNDGVHVAHSWFRLPGVQDAVFDLPDFLFYSDGKLQNVDKETNSQLVFTLQRSRIGAQGLWIDEKGIYGTCSVYMLTDSTDMAWFHFEKVRFMPNGEFYSENTVFEGGFSIGGLTCSLENVVLNAEGLQVGEGSFELPKKLGGGTITQANFLLGFDGRVTLWTETDSFTPFEYKGFTIGVKSMVIADKTVTCSGWITIPETFPGEREHDTIELTDLTFNTDGDILSYSVNPKIDLGL